MENTLVTLEWEMISWAVPKKVQTIMGKMDEWLHKTKNFYSMEDTVDKGDRWETDWEKIITTFKTDKGLISKTIKQFLQINKKKRGIDKEYE